MRHPGLPTNPRERKRTDLIRRLGSSTFNYWFGYVANICIVIWLVGHALPHGRALLGPIELFALAAIGLCSWTLTEYLLHRYVYHEWSSFLTEGHRLHHLRPRDLIGVPWYLTTIAIVALFEVLTLFLRPSATGVVMGFNWLGYIFYCISHHGSHHWALGSGWLGRMKRHHLIHHAYPEYNWGFTTPLWDHVLGTYTERRPRDAQIAVAPLVAGPAGATRGSGADRANPPSSSEMN
jgi:4-hydroxysphinganine ceramide fatty acyl 2-hydroxylase